MFRYAVQAAIALAISAPAMAQQAAPPAPAAQPPGESRLGTISRCIAYYAILGGMDGNKPVDSNTAAVVKDLGTELYVEAAKFSIPEETIQNAVVGALVGVNMSAKEDGMDKVTAAMQGECETLVDSVRGMP